MQVNFILIILVLGFFVLLGLGLLLFFRYVKRSKEQEFKMDTGSIDARLAQLNHHRISRVEAGIRMKTIGSWRAVSAPLDLVLIEGNILLLPTQPMAEFPSVQVDSHQGSAIPIKGIQCFSNTSAVFFDDTGTIQVEVQCGNKTIAYSILTSKRVEDLQALFERYDIMTHSPN